MKKLAKIFLVVALLLVLVVVGLGLFINTGNYRGALESAIASSTGYQLTIAGDLELDLFPNLGLTLNDVRLRNPASPQELASTSAISLRVDGRQLLRGQLLVQELLADDFHVNYYVDADGASGWVIQDSADAGAAPAADPAAAGGDIVTLSFERIRIDNASIDYQDLSQGARYSISNLQLDSRDTNIEGRPFSLDVELDFSSNGLGEPVPIALTSSVSADINAGSLALADINLAVTPLLLGGSLAVEDFTGAARYRGELASNSFDILGLLQTLGLSASEDEFSGSLPGSQEVQLSLALSGDSGQLSIDQLTGSVAGADITGNASVRFATEFTPTNISYEIIGGAIDLTPFLAGDEEAGEDETAPAPGPLAATPATAAGGDDELPTAALAELNVLGSIAFESLTLGDLTLQDINLFTNVEDGVLDIELQPTSAYGGTVQGSARLDARATEAALSTQFSLQALNIAEFRPAVSRINTVTGNLNLEGSYTAAGATVSDLTQSLAGSVTFAITENSVDIGVIKQVFTAIAALSPSGESIQQWPDVIQFGELGGYLLLEGGINGEQQLRLKMDNFDVGGSGSLDLDAGSFSYDLSFALLGPPEPQTIPINELYHGVQWPVDCSASFADEVSQYCRPDFNRVRDIFAQIGTNALRSRLQEEITDQVPEELRDAARGLLRNIFN